MASKQLTIPDLEHKKEQNQLTLKRLFKYMENNNLSLNYVACCPYRQATCIGIDAAFDAAYGGFVD